MTDDGGATDPLPLGAQRHCFAVARGLNAGWTQPPQRSPGHSYTSLLPAARRKVARLLLEYGAVVDDQRIRAKPCC